MGSRDTTRYREKRKGGYFRTREEEGWPAAGLTEARNIGEKDGEKEKDVHHTFFPRSVNSVSDFFLCCTYSFI